MKLTDYAGLLPDFSAILFQPPKYVASIEMRRWSEVAGDTVLEWDEMSVTHLEV